MTIRRFPIENFAFGPTLSAKVWLEGFAANVSRVWLLAHLVGTLEYHDV
jgi:hypothetical protein